MPPALPAYDLLLPRDRAGVLPPRDGEPDLLALFADAEHAGRRHVRGNMVGTLDGGGVGPDGRSNSLSSPADRRLFRVLRALADVVLVGAGTVRAEGYRELPVAVHLRDARAALGRAPGIALAVVTRRGHVPSDVRPGGEPPLVVTGTAGRDAAARAVGAGRVVTVPVRDGALDLAAGLNALAARGLHHVLTEGGPSLLGDLLGAGLVDELCLTTTPLLAGPGAPGLLHGGWRPDPPAGAVLRHLLHADGTLLARWDLAAGRTTRPTATPASDDGPLTPVGSDT
ncbi:dihydrofolate reductase family protein [Cellulomonas shaoxiangyii]|uniref:Deaminase n=1 Tax=Cellulomonas shaoxiangyii TaxID=2566013 RepID=A0A4P7SKT7_9CELL|nr:dihydrofolate reductase family protein [Cellulomonas shaoxiangyii]QCB93776.1 deaminase [Cellulomonas shaoxiangyii]TGY77668.1 deaminase [Cellulomonas shaoxiangyii]